MRTLQLLVRVSIPGSHRPIDWTLFESRAAGSPQTRIALVADQRQRQISAASPEPR